MAQDRFTLYSSDVVYAGPTTLTLPQIRSLAIDPGQALDETTPGGAVDRAAIILGMADPTVRLSTDDLATVLAVLSATAGLACTGGATFRQSHRAASSTFDLTTGVTAASSAGFLYPESLSASQGSSPALLNLAYKAFSSDGSTAPLAVTSGVNISAATAPTFVAKHFLGPVYFGSTKVEGVLSHSVNFGFQFVPAFDSGDIFARKGYIVMRQPSFSFVTTDLSWLYTRTNLFLASLGSALKVYYLNGVAGASRTALASSAHAKFTASTGVDQTTGVSSQDNGDGTATISVLLTGTLGMSLASAVP